jgi:hypothetical protein
MQRTAIKKACKELQFTAQDAYSDFRTGKGFAMTRCASLL